MTDLIGRSTAIERGVAKELASGPAFSGCTDHVRTGFRVDITRSNVIDANIVRRQFNRCNLG
ncbi:hypothetical protein BH10CHL1_BH10CHL1_50890 [soil metagenome]